MIRVRDPGWLLALLMLQLSCFVELLNAGWEEDWSKILSAARKEGKVADCRRTRQAVSGCGGSV